MDKPKKKPLTVDTIKVEKTSDTKREYHSRAGKEYGLGVNQFIYTLFCLNEDLPRVKKMTDAEIRRQIATEYARYKDTREFYGKKHDAIVDARQRFNRGQLGPDKGHPPRRCSFRYNERGEAIHRGRIMTDDARADYIAHWTATWINPETGKFNEGVIVRDWMLPPNHPLVLKWVATIGRYSARSKELWRGIKAKKDKSGNMESGRKKDR